MFLFGLIFILVFFMIGFKSLSKLENSLKGMIKPKENFENNNTKVNIENKCKVIQDNYNKYNNAMLNSYLLSILKLHLNIKEYDVLRMSYGLDCEKLNAKQIAKHLDIKGSSSYVRVSQLKKQAIPMTCFSDRRKDR